MKYCEHCGAQLEDDATQCTHCGKTVRGGATSQSNTKTLITCTKLFFAISCVLSPILTFLDNYPSYNWLVCLIAALIPLAWCIPMTVVAFRKLDKGEKFSIAFKICTLLFVSIISGILLFIVDNSPNTVPAENPTPKETPFEELNTAAKTENSGEENTDNLKF